MAGQGSVAQELALKLASVVGIGERDEFVGKRFGRLGSATAGLSGRSNEQEPGQWSLVALKPCSKSVAVDAADAVDGARRKDYRD